MREAYGMAELITILEQADHLKAALHKHLEWNQRSVLDTINVEYTYDSNRIEGNTLTLRETDLVIHQGLTIGDKLLVEHLEAINHYDAVGLIRELAQRQA